MIAIKKTFISLILLVFFMGFNIPVAAMLLQTDPTMERPEKLKPIFSVTERQDLLEAIKYIDRVITYTYEHELYELIENGAYDLRFLGDDYKGKSYTGDDLGIEVHYLDRSHGWSTTKYKELIAKSLQQH